MKSIKIILGVKKMIKRIIFAVDVTLIAQSNFDDALRKTLKKLNIYSNAYNC